MKTWLEYSALLGLLVGMFMLLEGSRFIYGLYVDVALMAVGGALILFYIGVFGSAFKDKKVHLFGWHFKEPRTLTLLLILLALGVNMAVQSVIKNMVVVDKLIFAAMGAALIVVSVAYIMKSRTKAGLTK